MEKEVQLKTNGFAHLLLAIVYMLFAATVVWDAIYNREGSRSSLHFCHSDR